MSAAVIGTLASLRAIDMLCRERQRGMAGWADLVAIVDLVDRMKAAREEAERNPPPFSYAPAYLPRNLSQAERRIFAAAEAKRARRAARRAGAAP